MTDKQLDKRRQEDERGLDKTLEQSIDVSVPARAAYNQWTQFEAFPKVMKGVQTVRQIDERHVSWSISIDGREADWVAEIVEQIPDKRIAWRSISGPKHAGVVTFHRIDDDRCRVMLQMDYEPEGVAQKTADWLGLIRQQLRARLEDFKQYLEERGRETGAWRGSIPSKDDARKEQGAGVSQ